METVLENDIPHFVKASPYLQALLNNGPFPEAGIEVPKGCAKQDLTINSASHLIELLQTLRFWMVPEVLETCVEFLRFAFDPQNKFVLNECAIEFEQTIPFVTRVHAIAYICSTDVEKVMSAIFHEYVCLLDFLYEECKMEVGDGFQMAATCDHLSCMRYFHARGEPLSVQVSNAAASTGQLQNLTYLYEHGGAWDGTTFKFAASGGSLSCLQYLIEHDCPGLAQNYDSMLSLASTKGHLRIVKYLWIEHGTLHTEWSEMYLTLGAAELGHISILKFARAQSFACFATPTSAHSLFYRANLPTMQYLYSVGQEASGSAMLNAVTKGDVEAMVFLLQHHCPVPEDIHTRAFYPVDQGAHAVRMYEAGLPYNANACAAAANIGNLECLKWLYEHNCPWDEQTCNAATQNGHLACLQYAYERGCPLSAAIANHAAQADSVECLQYVVGRGAALTTQTFCDAARNGIVSILERLLSLGCPFDGNACADVAHSFGASRSPTNISTERNERLACLRLLHERGAVWDERTCCAAARRSDFASLRYAHENGCPWDSTTLLIASQVGSLPCLRYAWEHGCPRDEIKKLCASAATIHRLECLQYLHEQGCMWDASTCSAAASRGCLDCLQYAHEHGCPWDEETCRQAYTRECYEYAMARGCPGAALSRFSDPAYILTANDHLTQTQIYAILQMNL